MLAPILLSCTLSFLALSFLHFQNEDEDEQNERVVDEEYDADLVENQFDLKYSFSFLMEEISFTVSTMQLLPSQSIMLISIHSIYILVFHVIMNFIPYLSFYVWKLSMQQTSFLAAIPSTSVRAADLL